MDAATRELVRARAGNRCEYCGVAEGLRARIRFHILRPRILFAARLPLRAKVRHSNLAPSITAPAIFPHH